MKSVCSALFMVTSFFSIHAMDQPNAANVIILPGGGLLLNWCWNPQRAVVHTLQCQSLQLIKRKIAIDQALEQKLLKAKPGDQYKDSALGSLWHKLIYIGKSSEKNSLQQLCKTALHKLAVLKHLDINSLALCPQALVVDIIPELEGALGLKRAQLDQLRLWLIAYEQQKDVSIEKKREQLCQKAADIAQYLQCNAQNREKKSLLVFVPELISVAWDELNQRVLNYGFMLNGSLRFKLASWFINHKDSQMPLIWRVNLGCTISLDETKQERIDAIMHDLAMLIKNNNIAYSVNSCFSNDNNTFKNNSALDYMLPFDNSEISIKRLEELTSRCKQVDIFTKPLRYLAVQTKHAIDEHSFSLRQLLWMKWLVDTIVVLEEAALEGERKANVGMCLMLSNIPYLEKSCLEMFPDHQLLAQELLSLMKKVQQAMVNRFKQNIVEYSHGSNVALPLCFNHSHN